MIAKPTRRLFMAPPMPDLVAPHRREGAVRETLSA
jgi:hypothetical protein